MQRLVEQLPKPDIPAPKLRQFRFLARALDAAEMAELKPLKRYALAVILIRSRHAQALDDAAVLLIRLMQNLENTAREKLLQFQQDRSQKTDMLVGQLRDILDAYNASAREAGDEDRVITFTDIVGALMGSVTDIINTISYVLVAFVAISLVVSSIMIGVITYISVLERKKEIGILRSIGASKRDIRRVFNAETLIVGFVAGVLGVAVTFLLTIPANAIVEANFDVPNVAQLPWQAAVILVLVSMGLTALAGLIPASAASRRDPVEALRSE